jgi:hypothetical protein
MRKNSLAIAYVVKQMQGRVGVPILLYFLGVPGVICVAIWFFFFKGT